MECWSLLLMKSLTNVELLAFLLKSLLDFVLPIDFFRTLPYTSIAVLSCSRDVPCSNSDSALFIFNLRSVLVYVLIRMRKKSLPIMFIFLMKQLVFVGLLLPKSSSVWLKECKIFGSAWIIKIINLKLIWKTHIISILLSWDFW